jgi:hypothetical protein
MDSMERLETWIEAIRRFLDERLPTWRTDIIPYMGSV